MKETRHAPAPPVPPRRLHGHVAPALAQGAFSTRFVSVLVPWAPGGPTDAFVHILSHQLSADHGQHVAMDHRAGTNGTIGMGFAACAWPDGFTVVVAPHLYQLPYINDRDFIGVGLLFSMPIFMLAHRSSAATNVVEYVLAPANLERLNAVSRAALRTPEMQRQLDALAVTAETRPLAEWPAYAAAEGAR